MTRCVFCRDDLENHHSNLQHPGGINRWLCGTCVMYIVTLNYIQQRANAERLAAEEARALEHKAAELATGIETP